MSLLMSFNLLTIFCMCASMSIGKTDKAAQKPQNKLNADVDCKELPLLALRRIHGPAFDEHYMSINRPLDIDQDFNHSDSRRGTTTQPFYVNEEHSVLLSDKPAWKIPLESFSENHNRRRRDLTPIGVKIESNNNATTEYLSDDETTLKRVKRKIKFEPWLCEAKIQWIDLGADYFPSYLRTTKCTKSKCFYNAYDCRRKSFPVRILKKHHGLCADATNLKIDGFDDNNNKTAQVWEWVEVAINFCCECNVNRG